nr:amino acid racemase [uncultured Chitinophaga sp.]
MYKKKKLGIIGGMGSRAGSFLLKKIIDYSPAITDQEFLEIIFHNNSITPDRTRAIIYNEPSPVSSLLKSIDLFNNNQVEVIAMGCMTAYYYFDQIFPYTGARIINPFQLIGEYLRDEHPRVTRVGLLATTGTVKTGLFHKALKDCGVEVVTLPLRKQEELFMRAVYMKNGFKSAHISDEARVLMLTAFRELGALNVDLIIGGCTEVSVGVDAASVDFPYLDMLDLLARETVDYCYHSDFVKI